MTTTIEDAAALLGSPPHEVKSVADTEAGTVVLMADGSSYIDVPADRPDREGKTGLMYHVAPCEGYNGLFPVFSAPPVSGIPDESPMVAPEPVPEAPVVAEEEEVPAAEEIPAAADEAAVPVRGRKSA